MHAVLKKCFDGFCQDGSIHVDTIGTILTMMGLRVKPSALKEIIEEVDEDGSGYLEFEEFCSLRCKPAPIFIGLDLEIHL